MRLDVRPRPGLWLPLPRHVADAATLAAHLRAYAETCAGTQRDIPQRQLLTTAAALDGCSPGDAAAMRRVVETLDWYATVAPAGPVLPERRIWESIAHAVVRIAEHVEWGGGPES